MYTMWQLYWPNFGFNRGCKVTRYVDGMRRLTELLKITRASATQGKDTSHLHYWNGLKLNQGPPDTPNEQTLINIHIKTYETGLVPLHD